MINLSMINIRPGSARKNGLPTTYGKTREYYYGDKVVYLTFDDGPNDKNTSRILDILKKRKHSCYLFA